MGTRIGRLSLAVGVLGTILAAAAPAFAEGHGGGHFSGGGHAGGGHAGGGHSTGGHFGGGGRAHALAGGGHAYAGGARGFAGVQHFSPGARYGGGHAAYGAAAGYHTGYRGGYSSGAYWGGGWWHGGYWPRAYYGLGFAWFLPILPLAYATYWWDGIPYYYANNVYYTWDPAYDGYVATDPPPVADTSGAAGAVGAPGYDGGGVAPVGAQIFMYPKNGQSEEQQSIDRRECQQWASSQAGAGAANGEDYRRAMIACVEGRGYSAK